MEGRRVVVVEANELPLRVVADVARSRQLPFFGGLLDEGRLIETDVEESVPRELYPSQTWASMNSGVSYAEHGIYWYGDHKPERYPMYWQVAARSGRSVGLVNTLHSSPVEQQCATGDYRFVIPDCFSADDTTIPDAYRPFQRANTSLTGANSRRTNLRPARSELVDLARSLPLLGLRPESMAELVRLAGGIALGRTPRERLRSGQFLVQRDLFSKLLDERTPDLAVLFTNHVAAAMHRYWYAMYPADFNRQHYGSRWVERYRHEISHAVVLLDRYLDRLRRWCDRHDRTLVVASSMGQGPSAGLCSDIGHEAVVVDPPRFLQAIGVDRDVTVLGSMAPQLTLGCGTPAAAAAVAAKLADVEAGEVFWDVDDADAVVTLTYRIDVIDGQTVELGGGRKPAESVGMQVYEVDDHSSGRHIRSGILGVVNSPTFKAPFDGVVDYLDFAPAMLQHLGVRPEPHHRMPGFEL